MPRWNTYTETRLSTITGRLKRRRVDLFVRLCRIGPHDTVLDLGAEDGSLLASAYPYPSNIVLADLHESPMRRGVTRYGLRGYRLISEHGPLPFDDNEFDAVWCNSVIEHVTLPRAQLPHVSDAEFRRLADARQRHFAGDISRIAGRYFVQTPYLHFPIEAHAWLPFVQYLPQRLRWRVSRILKPVWVKQWRADFLLYDAPRFRQHFPDADIFLSERVAGVPKSLIAVRTGDASRPPSPTPPK
jgi:SAM-dependent methyltransferase